MSSKMYDEPQGKIKVYPNSPEFQLNYGLTKEQIVPSLDIAILGHFQNEFRWQNLLLGGNVPAFHTVDLRLRYNFESYNLKLTANVNNLFNSEYYTYYGGPSIRRNIGVKLLFEL